MRMEKRKIVIPGFLIVGLIGALLVISDLGRTPVAIGQDTKTKNESSSAPSSAREFADQLSTLFEAASDKVSPSVVPIFSEQEVNVGGQFGSPGDPFHQFFGDEFFKRFFGQVPQGDQKQTVRGLGSGVIVSSDGHILTNNHVIENSEKVEVMTNDGHKYRAEIVGTDVAVDLALLKIEPGRELPTLPLGNSDRLRVGEWVIAIGNPLEFDHTVTVGVVSGKERQVTVPSTDNGIASFIQTDAAINLGNSGGPLLDARGNVIGINTAIRRQNFAEGMGFALPINTARGW